MAYDPEFKSAEQTAILNAIVERARTEGETGVAVFDLDGCLFDTRPRQIHILREFAALHGHPELYRLDGSHFRDWSLRQSMKNAGIADTVIEKIHDAADDHWRRHFFTSDYVLYDHAMPGAAQLVWDVYRHGCFVVYLTGRHGEMRSGTEKALVRFGFPFQRPRTELIVKPDFHTDDLAFKNEALREIETFGQPVIFIDNEPANINLFRDKYAAATVVFVATDHSFRPVTPYPTIPVIRGFLR